MSCRVTSIWENSLQITTISSFTGAWLGAFPIPLDWERPWQVGFKDFNKMRVGPAVGKPVKKAGCDARYSLLTR